MITEEEIEEALARGEITPEEAAAYIDAPVQKEKPNIFTFFNKILKAVGNELSKVSNIRDDEIRALNSLRSGAIYAEVHELTEVQDFFNKEVDNYLSLCDSRKGFLIQSAITQRRETRAGTWTPEKKKLFGLSSSKEED